MATSSIESWLNEECPDVEVAEMPESVNGDQSTVKLISEPQELWIHYQTDETLERLGHKILDLAQKIRDRKGRRMLAAGLIAHGLEKYSKPVDHYFVAPADRGDDCAACGKDIHVHPTLAESAAVKGVQFSDEDDLCEIGKEALRMTAAAVEGSTDAAIVAARMRAHQFATDPNSPNCLRCGLPESPGDDHTPF
jgi:hypothetical protein